MNRKDSLTVHGFYDGNNIFRVRFIPTKMGKWSYTIRNNVKEHSKGYVVCTATTKDTCMSRENIGFALIFILTVSLVYTQSVDQSGD
ncbi:MAG: DUF5060 domain-containing protein [Dysgonomonas sp.]|uniref:DUF5060 domain-containing protein n=1 Tax=Dysgonomonas sp. TaxID=1891233 RepID=UPI0039E2B419